MALFKCKMCGGDLEIAAGMTVAECEYCGTKQTLPKVNDEVVQNLFNRANNLRIKCEFDKAEQIYEKILHENEAEAEAHWGIVLCKYGIEYVEDPKTFKRIPTCHRTSYDAVTTDADYLAAIEHADTIQKGIYEAEAKAIDAIQKDILNIVKNEKPFDVFICYKETDENGKRTVDSVIANDIYYQLTQEGLKVFYAAITLEDKLGQEYEPYIFAALNSAKVMLVIGTKPKYFSSVWVKNEWSRFLKLMKEERSKLLIPCYKDMDAYDLPEEFSHLQAQDMGKIGFINDVVRGIKKVTVSDEPKPTVVKETVITEGNANATPLLERAFMFLEDKDWNSANEYCEKVLDIDPKNAQAYLGKLMAELRVSKQEYLKDYREPFDNKNNYQKTIRFADEKLKSSLADYIKHINTRNENNRLNGIYTRAKDAMEVAETEDAYKQAAQQFETIPDYQDAAALAKECYEKAQNCVYTLAKNAMEAAKTEDAYKQAAQQFETIPDYQDAATLAKECYEKAEDARKDKILADGKSLMNSRFERISDFEDAILKFEKIPGWKDADAEILACQKKIEEIKAAEEAARIERERNAEIARKEAERLNKKKNIITGIVAFVAVIAIVLCIVWANIIRPNNIYDDAMALMNDGKYAEALTVFESLNKYRSSAYKDSADKINECNDVVLGGEYNNALALMNEGKYIEAITTFEALDGYKDSAEKIIECEQSLDDAYNNALELLDTGRYPQALTAFKALEGYEDSADMIEECEGNVEAIYLSAIALMNNGNYAEALTTFEALEGYKDSADMISKCKKALDDAYSNANSLLDAGDKASAAIAFAKIGEYKDATEQSIALWDEVAVRETISAGYNHTLGLKSNGAVVGVGSDRFGMCTSPTITGKNAVSVTATVEASFVLLKDGMVIWSGSILSACSDVTNWTDIVTFSASDRHVVGLKRDGTVIAIGDNDDGKCYVDDWTDIVAISAGGSHTVGLKADGTVVAVGDNIWGQCNVKAWKDIIAISAGNSHTVGLKADGTVVAVGRNDFGPCDVDDWTDIIAISAGKVHTVGLRADGTVVAVGDNDYGQCDVRNWNDIVAINAGNYHTVGLKADGTVVAVGNNDCGQCDVSDWTDIKLPN